MDTNLETVARENLVNHYFDLIKRLRAGDAKSVDELMALWHPDGVFEFAGAAPVIGSYKGHVAIKTLYQNRLLANGMSVQLEGHQREQLREASMAIVATEVTHLRSKGEQLIAGWRTTIGTNTDEGFDISGSHLFTFDGNLIVGLRVNISATTDQSANANLRLEGLSVQDVGRLSLAAWPVV